MYNKFFGLHSTPFGTSPDPRYLFMMPHVHEALACVEYGIRARKGFIVLTGEVGTGKTTILRRAIEGLDPALVSTAFLFNPCLEVLDFFEFLLADFGLTPATRTKSGMLLQFNRWLIDRYRAKGTCVLVIDEAQGLSRELMEEIRLLTNLETNAEKLLQIVLCGQPELETKLLDPSLRQLRQRVSLWARTQPLTGAQTSGYIAERLRVAGTERQIFSSASVRRIWELSGGIPRLINLLCEHALLAAYVDQKTLVSPQMVEAVGADLEIGGSVAGDSGAIGPGRAVAARAHSLPGSGKPARLGSERRPSARRERGLGRALRARGNPPSRHFSSLRETLTRAASAAGGPSSRTISEAAEAAATT